MDPMMNTPRNVCDDECSVKIEMLETELKVALENAEYYAGIAKEHESRIATQSMTIDALKDTVKILAECIESMKREPSADHRTTYIYL